MSEEYKGKQVLVVGLGVSGKAASRFLLKRGARVTAVDRQADQIAEEPSIVSLRGIGLYLVSEQNLLEINHFDFVVVSPGIPEDSPIYKRIAQSGKWILGEIELACRSMNQKAVAITGTNGKTTTTLLTTHVLNFAGKKAHAVGNIGIPLTDLVDEASLTDIFVVELSSWQLETLQANVFDAAAILNITANHLDRHKTMEAYAQAKFRIAASLRENGTLYIGNQVERDFSHLLTMDNYETYGFDPSNTFFSDGEIVYYKGQSLFHLPTPYTGKINHDLENLMAAYALCRQMGVSADQFVRSLDSFKKPAHRVEFVTTLDGVNYYDDSKGTNVEAVIRAVEAMEGKTLLIAGGVHKGASYLPWAKVFKGKVREIYAIGEARELIADELGDFIPVKQCRSLDEAVRFAAETAQNGENVLLSPGCSSYDMFRDYNHRGDEFKRIVHTLQSEVFKR